VNFAARLGSRPASFWGGDAGRRPDKGAVISESADATAAM
jgi:hypothetical protein